MRAFVDPDLCIGCTQCAGLCPEVYTMEGSLAVARPDEIPGEDVPQAVEAAEACPVSAIRVEN
ncbi:MAG: ferredoxin [Candidatus Faecalibacterium intestinavium]|uniref:Ferredoxin n=1 Tax=Candidatus Faecalibacterium intestinavium TaxID=2838580 RepID=A0A9E2KKN4_9FIRM|nr:ferredoxin [Candidatus Faecalibacterium intestinavium]